tara:strand:+ start:1217 stop:1483 length:267 start_codon:yes stop_codon:yes gene_type:complete
VKYPEPTIPRYFLVAIVTFKIAMMQGVIKRAWCEAAFVFDQQVFIICMGHCSPGALENDMENKMNGMAGDNPVYANTAEVDEVLNWMH